MDSESPIGVFDSGVGGLTVLKALRIVLPGEDFIYFGDTARVPYGTRSPETVIEYTTEVVDFLLNLKVKALVIACNTVTSWALDTVLKKTEGKIPVIGVIEPGILEALRRTRNSHVGVIGTTSTIRSRSYEEGLLKRRPGLKISSVACPAFVSVAEEGWRGDIPDLISNKYLSHLDSPLWAPLNATPDTLILGCTHFPLLEDSIRKTLPRIKLVDPAYSTAEETKEALRASDLLSRRHKGSIQYLVTDNPTKFHSVGSHLMGSPLSSVELVSLMRYT